MWGTSEWCGCLQRGDVSTIKQTKKPFDRCLVCGGEIVEKEVGKLLRGGADTAVVKVHAEVCLHCGERLYSQETVRRFERMREKLDFGGVGDFGIYL